MGCATRESIALDAALDKARWILETFLPEALAEYREERGLTTEQLPDPQAYYTVDILRLDDGQGFATDLLPAVAVYDRADATIDESGICGIDHEVDLDVTGYATFDGRTLEHASRLSRIYAIEARRLLVGAMPSRLGGGSIWNAQAQPTPDTSTPRVRRDVWTLSSTRWMRVTYRAERPSFARRQGIGADLLSPLAQQQAELRVPGTVNGVEALPGRLVEVAVGTLTVALPVPDGSRLFLVDQQTGAEIEETFSGGSASASPDWTDDRLWTLTAQTPEGSLWSSHGRFAA